MALILVVKAHNCNDASSTHPMIHSNNLLYHISEIHYIRLWVGEAQ